VLAQQVSDQDVLGQMAKAWNNFIKTGQVWALLIGVVIGYIFRGFTSF
jgi:large-conductance mechanosensitive channel